MGKSSWKETWVVSDTHFSHARSLEFFNPETGEKMRHWEAGKVEEMNEHMVERWNSVIKPTDKVIHCGDAWFTKDGWKNVARLNGVKELVMGNHDDKDMALYTQFFKRLHGSYTVRTANRNHDLILTHIPIHTSQFGRFFGNVHGHIHRDLVKLPDGTPDPRYLNVCVEMIDYTPITLGECLERIKKRRDDMNWDEPSLGRG